MYLVAATRSTGGDALTFGIQIAKDASRYQVSKHADVPQSSIARKRIGIGRTYVVDSCLPADDLSRGRRHPLLGAHADQIALELGDHRQHSERQPSDRIGGVASATAEVQCDTLRRQLVRDVANFHRPAELVELGKPQECHLPGRPPAPPAVWVRPGWCGLDRHQAPRVALRLGP